MSDQAKWLKLWESALTDAHLENLSLDNWARYIRLMLYVKCHGHLGTIKFPEPYRAIMNLFRVDSIEMIKAVLVTFPHVNYKLDCVNGETSVTLNIHIQNWYKYQIDSSAHRVRKWRAKVTQQKRREESNDSSSLPRASRTGSAIAPPAATRETPGNGEPMDAFERAVKMGRIKPI